MGGGDGGRSGGTGRIWACFSGLFTTGKTPQAQLCSMGCALAKKMHMDECPIYPISTLERHPDRIISASGADARERVGAADVGAL